jgi:hypothetical protein
VNQESIGYIEIGFFILFIVALIVFAVVTQKAITKLYWEQAALRKSLTESLNAKGFRCEKMIHIAMPERRFLLNKNWVPAVSCFLCVDNTHEQWAISQGGDLNPKIYSYSDFKEFNVEINGKSAGSRGRNAVLGYIFFGLAGAACAAAMTKSYGMIKKITINVRVHDFKHPTIEIPVVNAPLKGLKDKDKGLDFIVSFASQMEQTFHYIAGN